MIVRLKGAGALVDDPAPARRIAELYGVASKYVHNGCTEEQSRQLLSDVEDVLWTVFRPPDLPGARLSALARQTDPSDEVAKEVKGLLASTRDWEAFLELVPTPTWLLRLNQGTHFLDPPDQLGGQWTARGAAVRLSKDHRKETVEWVMEIFGRHRGGPEICVNLASVLLDMGPPAVGEALEIVKCHPEEAMLLLRVVDALRDSTDPSSILVKDAADRFLNTLVQDQEDSNPTLQGGQEDNYYLVLLGMLSDGATPDNAVSRLEMLGCKLEIARRHWRPSSLDRMVAEMLGCESVEMPSDRWRFHFGHPYEAPISTFVDCESDYFSVKAVNAISACLVRIFQAAMKWLSASALLKLSAQVPEPLGHRLGVWALSEMEEADLEEMVRAVESAVISRMPNCDDVALIDRVVSSSEDVDAASHMSRWQAALGEPPSLSEAEEAVNSDSTWQVYSWFYPYFWVPLLPKAAASTWTGSEAFQLLIKKMPPSGRAEFDEIANKSPKPEKSGRSGPVQFSLSADELSCMEPADAAREIASYPVAQDERTRETLILGSMLPGLVKADPSGWGTIRTASQSFFATPPTSPTT